MSPMLDWMKRRGSPTADHQREVRAETPKPPGRAMSGKYLLLYKYLENRYANTVVLTFAEIEDLLGFALPDAGAPPAGVVDGRRRTGPDRTATIRIPGSSPAGRPCRT